jgi:hypothetical protein
MISDLKPDVLERYVTGAQALNTTVPVQPGNPPMTASQFLNASMAACGCYIIPRLSLDEYDKGTLFKTAENLLSLPVYPRIAYLSLDNWAGFNRNSSHTPAIIQSLFKQLYAEGWRGIGVNDCGGFYVDYGYATWADFCISENGWVPNSSQLAQLKSEPNIKLYLLYIDFPNFMQDFVALPVDQQASILANNIAPAQSQQGFMFVYPIVQNFWDSSKETTTQGGPYHGETIYVLMRSLMNQYNPG